MLRFLDGPAAGVSLCCARAPLFLRVVQDTAGKWDSLDQLADTPAPGETIHVYRKVSSEGTVHIDYRDAQGRRRGRWEQIAGYRLHEVQPDDATLRETAAWRAWATAEQARRKQGPAPEASGA